MKARSVLQVVSLTAVLTGLHAGDVHACECIQTGPPCQAVWEADAVFGGTVLAIEEPAGAPFASYVVRIHVERAFRNSSTGPIDIVGSNSTCDYRFTVGRRYVIYATKTDDGRLRTSICSRTKPLEEAADDLKYLNALPAVSNGARLYGQVKQREWDPGPEVLVDYGPMEGIRVYVTGTAFTRETQTDADGRYEFAPVPAGTYRLGIIVPPEFDSRHLEREFEVRDVRTCVKSDFDIRWEARISGVVVDAAGRPIPDLIVEAIPEQHAAVAPRPYSRPEATTDARGAYQLVGVPPGRYVIAVSRTRRRSNHAAHGRTLFPGTTVVSQAEVVEVGPGERRELRAWSLSEDLKRQN